MAKPREPRPAGRAAAASPPPRPPDIGPAGSRARGWPARGRARSGAGCRGTCPSRAGDEDIFVVPDTDLDRVSASRTSASPSRIVPRATSACSPASVARNQLLATSAAIDCRAIFEVRLRRRGVGGSRGAAVAHAAPQIELPVHRQHPALQPGAVARTSCRRRAPEGRPKDRVSRRRAARRSSGLFDARGGHAQVGIVRDGFGDGRRQGVIAKRRPASWRTRPRSPRQAPSSVAGISTVGIASVLDRCRVGRLLQARSR